MQIKKTTQIVLAAISFVMLLGFVNCSAPNSVSSQVPSAEIPSETGASEVCTTNLESQMTEAFQKVPTTEAFYVELRRFSDGRIFRMNRTVSGKSAVTESTMLQSASTAKMISAAVILDVIANPANYPGGGKVNGQTLTLDSPIRNFLPYGTGTAWRSSTGALPTNNRLYSVTLRQLLSFTSGLAQEDNGCIVSNTPANQCIISLVDRNLMANSGSAPRTFYYSGAHLFVAAQVAVNASGLANWAALFKRFKEIHGLFQTPIANNGMDAVYGVGAFFPASTASPSPAGALRYAAGDYGLFLDKLARQQILPSPFLNEMLSDQLTQQSAQIAYSPMQNDGEEWHYGLGLWTECAAASFSASCFEDRYSSPGSFGSYPFIDFNALNGQERVYVGFVGYGGTQPGQAKTVIDLYRSALGGGQIGVKDLAQKWAASSCP